MVNTDSLLITNEYIREALDQLIRGTQANGTSPLEFMQLIDLHMLTSDFTFFQQPRRFALNDLLVSTIRAEYLRQRALHMFEAFDSGIALSNALNFIAQDASSGNSDLVGWSWLYFRYVEINLRVSQQQFCHAVNLDNRTIRRYENTTIDQLAKQLIGLEQNARQSRRRQMLYLQLPHQGTALNLIEREKELQRVRRSKLKHCFIVGAAGIGKTAFVELVVKEQIDNDKLDHVIWLHAPDSVTTIKSYLRERLLSEDSKIGIIEYISLKKTTIVIDNAEKLLRDLLQFQDFLQEFSIANIYFTSHLFYPMSRCLQINLSELSVSGVEFMLATSHSSLETFFNVGDKARLIWSSVGGNPLAIELLVQNWSIFEFHSAISFTLDQMFSHLFDSMTISEHLAWLILALMHNESLTLFRLSRMEFGPISFTDFATLERLSIAKTTSFENGSLTLTVSAINYIQMRYMTNLRLQHSFERLIVDLGASKDDLNLAVIESALTTDWLILSSDNYLALVRSFWKDGLGKGHYTKWYVILGRLINELTPYNLDLTIAYGISQRHLGQWSSAVSTFSTVVQYAGTHGLFANQAEALLETAIVLRYQGDYVGTVSILDHLNNSPDAVMAELDLRHRIAIERIEIALERNDIDVAKSLVSTELHDGKRKQILELEIFAREPKHEKYLPFLVSISDKLLLESVRIPSLTSRIHILLGRIYQNISDINTATRHLSIAQSILLDIDNDPFALARTQCNLAALLIASNSLIDAQELLKSAENIQRKIGDRVGLAATLHNEHVLDRKIVN